MYVEICPPPPPPPLPRTGLEAHTPSAADMGQQPTTWTGMGCCSTGGNQQRSQPSAEQGLQPGKKTARRNLDPGAAAAELDPLTLNLRPRGRPLLESTRTRQSATMSEDFETLSAASERAEERGAKLAL